MSRRIRAMTATVMVAGAVVAAGTGFAADPESGSVLAFGSNQHGQLGSATNSGIKTPNPAPRSVDTPAGAGAVVQVAAGAGHTLMVTSSGQLLAFGGNEAGQLGIAPAGATPTPTPAPVTLPGQIGTVAQVAAGGSFSLAVTSSGQLYAFGSNQYGQLGNTTNNGALTPNPTPTLVTLPGLIGTAKQVSAGQAHSLVLTSSGQLYAFGHNHFGELGSTTNNNTATATPTPALVTPPGQIGTLAQVVAGGNHSLALTSSGQLYAFGRNYSGQLGNVTGNVTDTPNPTPTLVTLPGQVGPVTQIAGGALHSVALTSSGQVYAFGGNQSGQLGNAINTSTGTANPTPVLVPLPGQIGLATQIAGGDQHSLVVTSSGQLYSFGSNYLGQLGYTTNSGGPTPNPTATLVALPPGATIGTVAKGSVSVHSLALVSNLAIVTAVLGAAQAGTPYQSALQASGGTGPLRWSASGLPGGLKIDAASGAIGGTPDASGSFSPTVTLTDAYGTSVGRTYSLTVAASPLAAAKAPRLSALKQSASRWLAGSKLARLVITTAPPVRKRGLPVGTTFSFRLDQAARVTLAFRHNAQGRKVAGKCVAKTKGNAGKPRCTRTVGNGALRIRTRAGASKLRFEGRLSSAAKLKAGRYTVVISATNDAGKTSPAQSRSFTIAGK